MQTPTSSLPPLLDFGCCVAVRRSGRPRAPTREDGPIFGRIQRAFPQADGPSDVHVCGRARQPPRTVRDLFLPATISSLVHRGCHRLICFVCYDRIGLLSCRCPTVTVNSAYVCGDYCCTEHLVANKGLTRTPREKVIFHYVVLCASGVRFRPSCHYRRDQ